MLSPPQIQRLGSFLIISFHKILSLYCLLQEPKAIVKSVLEVVVFWEVVFLVIQENKSKQKRLVNNIFSFFFKYLISKVREINFNQCY